MPFYAKINTMALLGLWGVLTGSGLLGYWANYVTLTCDLNHELDIEIFNVKV